MRSALKNIVGERVRDNKTRDFVWNDAVQLHGMLWSRQLRAQPVSSSFQTNTMCPVWHQNKHVQDLGSTKITHERSSEP